MLGIVAVSLLMGLFFAIAVICTGRGLRLAALARRADKRAEGTAISMRKAAGFSDASDLWMQAAVHFIAASCLFSFTLILSVYSGGP